MQADRQELIAWVPRLFEAGDGQRGLIKEVRQLITQLWGLLASWSNDLPKQADGIGPSLRV